MQSFPYNSNPINGAGGFSNIVYLPSGDTGMGFLLYERASALMQGAITKEVTLLGDISRIALIGAASVNISFTLEGELTRNQTVYFDASDLGFSFAIDGDLTKLRIIPASGIDTVWTVGGDLSRLQTLKGVADMGMDLSGPLLRTQILGASPVTMGLDLSGVLGATQYLAGDLEKTLTFEGQLSLFSRNYIGFSNVSMAFGVSGNLTQTIMLAGDVTMSIDATGGSMAATRFLAGDLTNHFDVSGLLSNNASVQDLFGFLMIRRKSVREMTR